MEIINATVPATEHSVMCAGGRKMSWALSNV